MDSIINAIKRLERAGNENSKANQKLHEAVVTVGDFLIKTVPVGVWFNCHYDNGQLLGHSEVEYNRPSNSDLYYGEQLVTGLGTLRPRQGFVTCNYLSERETEFHFAREIANGLIQNAIAAVEKHTGDLIEVTDSVKEVVAAL